MVGCGDPDGGSRFKQLSDGKIGNSSGSQDLERQMSGSGLVVLSLVCLWEEHIER